MVQNKYFSKVDIEDALRVGDSSAGATLLSSMVDNSPLSDNGEQYGSVQEAVTNSTNWTFVPNGTFQEEVTISQSNFSLVGSGGGSVIQTHANATNAAIYTESGTSNVEIRNLRADGDDATAIRTDGEYTIVADCVVHSNQNRGIWIFSQQTATGAGDCIVVRNRIDGSGTATSNAEGILFNGERCIGDKNIVHNVDDNGMATNTEADDTVISHNAIRSPSTRGIFNFQCNDSIMLGNQIINSADDGIETYQSTDAMIANNNISGAGGVGIDDGGTTTTLDANEVN